jgi:hypothetical protein
MIKMLNVVSDPRRKQIDSWIAALSLAEATARSEPESKRRAFLINYRISNTASKTKGGEDSRREALKEIIQSMKPAETHLSTSTWMIITHIAKSEALARLLVPPLDLALDGLHVTQALPKNAIACGVTKLDS